MKQPATPRSGDSRQSGRSQRGQLLSRFARWIRDFMADYAFAQRRMAELMTAPDRCLIDPNRVPDTYEEFVFRTSGLMRHEPPARARATR
jgi:hypothetical protein